MGDLTLIKSANFGNVKCDFWEDDNGNILLTRKQIGQALEYADPQKAIDNLHAKHADRLDNFSVTLKVRGADGKMYDTTLYTVKGVMEICRWSQQPKANAFMDWVWEVMETIRKHGAYLTPQKIEEVLLNPDTIIKLAMQLKEEQTKRLEAEKKIQELQPKAEFFDAVAGSKDAIDMNRAAKLIYEETRLGRNKLFKLLRGKGILMKDNIPYQEYIDKGYFRTIEQKYTKPDGTTHIYIKTLVYQKGLDFIRKIVKEDNVIHLKRAKGV